MANGTGARRRFRPAGSRQQRQSAAHYGPTGTGCPVVEKAIEGLYRAKNESSFWTLMSALNYALEIGTRVLVPVQTALTVHNAPAPWTEHPIPAEKAEGLTLWTLRSRQGKTWLPLFTSCRAAEADRSTAGRPMVEKTMLDAMSLALDTEGIDGVVIDPWGSSATLDGALLAGLLHAEHGSKEAGEQELEDGQAAAAAGRWAEAARCFEEAAVAGRAEGLRLLGECLYEGNGVRRSRIEARKLWRKAAEAGDVQSVIALGDDCAASGNAGKALLYYRRARQLAEKQPDVEFMPQVCLRIAQTETRYVSPRQAMALAAEAAQGFRVRQTEGDPSAGRWLAEAEALLAELAEQPKPQNAYRQDGNTDSLQMD